MLILFRQAWENNPDQRLGQLIGNAAREELADDPHGRYRDPFYLEDDEIWKGLERMARGSASAAEDPG
jgi:hypothetical protein